MNTIDSVGQRYKTQTFGSRLQTPATSASFSKCDFHINISVFPFLYPNCLVSLSFCACWLFKRVKLNAIMIVY